MPVRALMDTAKRRRACNRRSDRSQLCRFRLYRSHYRLAGFSAISSTSLYRSLFKRKLYPINHQFQARNRLRRPAHRLTKTRCNQQRSWTLAFYIRIPANVPSDLTNRRVVTDALRPASTSHPLLFSIAI